MIFFFKEKVCASSGKGAELAGWGGQEGEREREGERGREREREGENLKQTPHSVHSPK